MRESEQRYQQLIRNSPVPINLFDASGEVIWGNDAVVDLLGLESRDQILGRSIFDFIHADDRYTAEEELAAVVAEKRSTGPTTMKLERDDGETRTIRVATAPGEYDGRDIGQAVIIDVTELNEMQAELERERAFIAEALDTLNDVFYVIDTAGVLERWNDTLLEASGYSEDDVRHMDVEEFFVTDDVERVSASIARAFTEGSDTLEATVRTKAGKEIPFEFRKRRLSKDGTVLGVVGIGRDISDRRRRDKHLKTVDLLLQHHLRNRLNVIQGQVGFLQEQLDDPDNEHISTLYAEIEQMLSIFDHHRRIIAHLTDATTQEHIDIVAVLENLVVTYRVAYPEAEFTKHLPSRALVEAVPAIEYALRELFRNAIKHAGPDPPTVEVSLTATDSSVRIDITDTGPPIPEVEYAFMDNPTALKPTAHPSGLGLWSVYLAVEQSGGTLTIDEADSGGNRITIDLPTPPREWT